MKIHFLFFFFLTLLSFSVFAKPSNEVVNIYNWANYIPKEVIKQFERETGVRVSYSTYDSNELLYSKIKANPKVDYDIIVPTGFIIQRMRLEGLLIKLDKTKIPNMRYLNPLLLNLPFDPGNQYSFPYLWGTTGIIVNTRYYATDEIQYWSDLWKPKYKNQVTVLDSLRDMMGMGLKVLGYSLNDQNPEHIKSAYEKLKALIPNIQAFANNASQQVYVNEDSRLGMMPSGNARIIIKEYPFFQYIYPKDGPILWIDNMAIPRGAQHIHNAYQFMNFILRPDIAKKIALGVGYSTPNLGAIQQMSEKEKSDPILNPAPSDLKNAEVESYVARKTMRLLLYYWELLKLNV